MKQTYKLFLSLLLIFGMFFTCFVPEGMAGYLKDKEYMYNGVIIASATYDYRSSNAELTQLLWTIYDESVTSGNKTKNPNTIIVKGDTVYDTSANTTPPNGKGTALCQLTVGNSYDIRVVFVHSKNKAPYYYLMIEGEGVINKRLSGTYTDGVWISAVKNSNTEKLTKGDGLEAIAAALP